MLPHVLILHFFDEVLRHCSRDKHTTKRTHANLSMPLAHKQGHLLGIQQEPYRLVHGHSDFHSEVEGVVSLAEFGSVYLCACMCVREKECGCVLTCEMTLHVFLQSVNTLCCEQQRTASLRKGSQRRG